MTGRTHYTAWEDPAIERFVQGRLDRIVSAVRGQMGADLEAILLSGGFGRGEGGVVRLPNGRHHVVNDFDIELVYREPMGRLLSKLAVQLRHRRALHHLAERLASEFEMKQVDLSLRAGHSLRTAVPKLADYDLLHGHRLLWGADDPTRIMRPFESREIPAFEGAWLLRNRGIGLVLARLYLDRGRLHDENTENFHIEINKAALAMGDALWILSGRYTVQYADRAVNFESLAALGYPRMAELKVLYLRAAEAKLRPLANVKGAEAPEAVWERMASLYGHFHLWYESKRLHRDFTDLAAYAHWINALPAVQAGHRLRRWMDRYLGTSGDCPASLRLLKYQPDQSIVFVAALLAARVGDPTAGAVLGAWPVAAEGQHDAWRLRARGLLALLHPGGEVGRFLSATSQERPSPPEMRAA